MCFKFENGLLDSLIHGGWWEKRESQRRGGDWGEEKGGEEERQVEVDMAAAALS